MTAQRYAFATSEAADTVTAIDLTTLRAAASLPTGRVPHSMALTPDDARLYVVNRHGASLTVIDPDALTVTATLPLSADPMAAAVSPDGRWLAVLGRTRSVAWVLDAATGAIQHEIPLAPAPDPDEAPITPPTPGRSGAEGGTASTHPAWAPDSASFYAQDNPRAALARLDPRSGRVVGRIALPSIAHAVYLDPDGARAYALCIGVPERSLPPSVAVVETATDRLLADIPIPLVAGESGALHHAAFDARAGRLFVANVGRGRPFGGRSVHLLDLGRLELTARLEARAGAGHPLLSPDDSRLFVVNHSEPVVSVFDAERLQHLAEVQLAPAGAMGHGCFFTADGRHFWAVSSSAGVAYALESDTLRPVAEVPTGPNCQDIAHDWRDAYA
jgi:YVTN family beta-propeller protein